MEKNDPKKQMDHLKLQCGVLTSIIISELDFAQDDTTRFNFNTYNAAISSNDSQLLELYILQHENVVVD